MSRGETKAAIIYLRSTFSGEGEGHMSEETIPTCQRRPLRPGYDGTMTGMGAKGEAYIHKTLQVNVAAILQVRQRNDEV